MTGRPPLGDRLALALIACGPQSGTTLAQLVGARKADALHALHADECFVTVDAGRASTWQLTDAAPREREPAPTSREREQVSDIVPASARRHSGSQRVASRFAHDPGARA